MKAFERQEIKSRYPDFTEEDVDAFLAFESFSQGRSDLYRMLATTRVDFQAIEEAIEPDE